MLEELGLDFVSSKPTQDKGLTSLLTFIALFRSVIAPVHRVFFEGPLYQPEFEY